MWDRLQVWNKHSTQASTSHSTPHNKGETHVFIYRSMKVHNSVNLDNPNVQRSLDRLADRLAQDGFKLVGSYAGSTVKVKFKCKNGHTFLNTPSEMTVTRHGNRQGTRTGCKQCFLEERHVGAGTMKHFKGYLKLYNLRHDWIDWTDQKKALDTETTFYCLKCGRKTYTTPRKLGNHVVPHCGRRCVK
jgi:RNase P subunit RPR2